MTQQQDEKLLELLEEILQHLESINAKLIAAASRGVIKSNPPDNETGH